ncbi:hypothetical protein ELQ92_00570 [Labedella populi]|uniref:Uncharacterized protein n=1 Tax=Labedella populi TaxID=2498850 RepID=A0A3S4A1S4_9MICO|nr:hypothetical protein [Labedella populi]RWZ67804.1 hypothetical protein ELQ92_00570 [Labedella populi]
MTQLAAPADYDPHTLAEFAEASLIVGDDDYLSAVEMLGLFPSGNQPTEAEIEDLLAEVERRTRQFGDLYPFRVEDRGIAFSRDGGADLYSTLVILSLKGSRLRRDKDYPRSDPIFDDIAERAFLAKMGVGAKSVQFGWPPRNSRPSGFPDAVAWLALQLGIPVRDDEIPSNYLDDGVDIFIWNPFPDGRAGFILMAAQNTVQFEYRKKPRDVVPGHWREWLRLGTDPTVGFAIPFAMAAGDPWWHTVQSNVHLVLDRGRILSALEGQQPESWATWSTITEFVSTERTSLEQLDDGSASILTRRKGDR